MMVITNPKGGNQMEKLQETVMALSERLSDAENKLFRSEEKIKELESQVDWLESCIGDI